MSDAPRRRRHAGQPRRPQSSQFPLVPLAIVIVLAGGFAIGAFFSQHREARDIAKTSTTTKRDVPPAQLAPLTAEPTAALSAEPTAQPAASPQPSDTPLGASISPAATGQKVPAPDALTAGSKRPARKMIAAAKPTVAATVPPPPSSAPTVPKPHPAPLPSSRRARASAAQTPTGSSSAAPVLSGAPDHVVRAYLSALIRGDQRAANTALGRGPDSGNSFPEQDFIDAKSHIKSLHTTASSDGGYTVETEVEGAKGLYFVTFQVQKTPDGYVIGDHSYIKP